MAHFRGTIRGQRVGRHTPGPWRVAHDLPGRLAVYGQTIKTGHIETVTPCVAHVPMSRSTDDTADTNSRLIAAAPEMLEALQEVLHLAETPGDFTDEERRNVLMDAGATLAKVV